MATTFTSRSPMTARLSRQIAKSASRNPIQQGFTLVELLVVVVILGILSGIGIPAILNQQKKAVAAANNTLAMSSARACAAAVAGGVNTDYEAPTTKAADGTTNAVTGTCSASGTGSTFTASTDPAKATAAVATITANGSVDLTTRSTPTGAAAAPAAP